MNSITRPWLIQHGKFDRQQVEAVYAAIDVVVLPAIYLEVFGLVVAEAMSSGRPVLVTDCGGPAEQVADGVDGWIVPPNDVDALAAMLDKLADNPQRVAGAAANVRLKKNHQQYITELEAAYQALLAIPTNRKIA